MMHHMLEVLGPTRQGS